MITVLVLLGQVLELRARERTGGAIRALLDLTPKLPVKMGPEYADIRAFLGEVRGTAATEFISRWENELQAMINKADAANHFRFRAALRGACRLGD